MVSKRQKKNVASEDKTIDHLSKKAREISSPSLGSAAIPIRNLENNSKKWKSVSRLLMDLLEKEYRRIGNQLQNEINQLITSVIIQMEGIKETNSEETGKINDRMTSLQDHLREATQQISDLTGELNTEVLDLFGFQASVEELADKFQRSTSIRLHLFIKNLPEQAVLQQNKLDLILFRLIQEALSNISKHAEASEVFIAIHSRDNNLSMTIEDDGKGFNIDNSDYDSLSKDRKFGIALMKARTMLVGGEFYVETLSGRGTLVRIDIPLSTT